MVGATAESFAYRNCRVDQLLCFRRVDLLAAVGADFIHERAQVAAGLSDVNGVEASLRGVELRNQAALYPVRARELLDVRD